MLIAWQLINSTIGRALIGLVLLLAVGTGAYWKGRSDRAAIDQSAALQARLTALQEDIKARDRIAASVRADIIKLTGEREEYDERVDAYEQELEAERKRAQTAEERLAASACLATPRDVDRVRQLDAPRPTGGPPTDAGKDR